MRKSSYKNFLSACLLNFWTSKRNLDVPLQKLIRIDKEEELPLIKKSIMKMDHNINAIFNWRKFHQTHIFDISSIFAMNKPTQKIFYYNEKFLTWVVQLFHKELRNPIAMFSYKHFLWDLKDEGLTKEDSLARYYYSWIGNSSDLQYRPVQLLFQLAFPWH